MRLDTPVGPVGAELAVDGLVTIENVPARCHARDVAVDVPGLGRVVGDVAYGGNWFFLAELPGEAVEPGNRERLRTVTLAIQQALAAQGVRGAGGELVDHVILFGPPARADADSRNYVMCPGGAYDRSPCGTGTSAKHGVAPRPRRARDRRRASARSRSRGSLFTGWLEERDGALIPRIQGRAFITGRTTLFFDPRDPFRHGLAEGPCRRRTSSSSAPASSARRARTRCRRPGSP